MPQASLIQIDTYGDSDFFLVSNPEITFFTKKYRRYTQFGIDTEIIDIVPLDFSEKISIILPRKTGLLSKLTLEIVLPKIDLVKPNSYNFEKLEIEYNRIRELYNSYDDYINSNRKLAIYILELLTLTNITNLKEDINLSEQYKLQKTTKKTLCALIDKNYIDTVSFVKKQKLNTIDIYKIFFSKKYNYETLNQYINRQYQILIEYNTSELVDEYTKIQKIYFGLKNKTLVERYKSAWCEEVGHFLIEKCSLYFNNQKIDNNPGIWLSMYSSLYYYKYPDSHGQYVYNKLIGNVPELTVYDDKIKNEYKLLIPLRYFFCNYYGQSLPVNALNNTEIRIDLELSDLKKVFFYEKNDVYPDIESLKNKYDINIVSSRMLADYIVLDKLEDDKFKTSSHEYLIQVNQHYSFDIYAEKKYVADVDMFEHPTLALIWAIQEKSKIQNVSGNEKPEPAKFESPLIIESMGIKYASFDFADIFLKPEYYNYVTSYKYFNQSMRDGLYSLSFCLDPTINQPTSSLNLSRFNSIKIFIEFIKAQNKELIITFFAPSFNILRCIGGYARLAYGSTMLD